MNTLLDMVRFSEELNQPLDVRFRSHFCLMEKVFNVKEVSLVPIRLYEGRLELLHDLELRGIGPGDSWCSQTVILDYFEDEHSPHSAMTPSSRSNLAGPLGPWFVGGLPIYRADGMLFGILCLVSDSELRLSSMQRQEFRTFARMIQKELQRDTSLKDDLRILRDLAIRDQETGLPRETLLEETLEGFLTPANPGNSQIAVMYIRVCNSDTVFSLQRSYGEKKILRAFVDRLVTLNEGFLCAGKIGSESLIVVLRVSSKNVLCDSAARILRLLTEPVQISNHFFRVEVRIGVSTHPTDGENARLLIDLAHRACSLASQQSPIQFYDANSDFRSTREHLIETRLESALLESQVFLKFQPIWLSDGSRIMKFEALARWEDEELGPISPSEFIPIVDKNPRLSRAFTRYVLREACVRAHQWVGLISDGPGVAVNIPAGEFYNPEFVQVVSEILSEAQLEPSKLILELTEECLIEDLEQTRRTMAEFAKKGIRLSLDDFGAGYSSLSHLSQLPVSVVKIDKMFIDSLLEGDTGMGVVSGIIKIAHGIGLDVVAEGVEQEAQRAALEKFGCDMIQGFLLGRPASPGQIPSLISDPGNSHLIPDV